MESDNVLNDLDADRATLASRIRTPWWLAAGFGWIGACLVVTPAFGGSASGVIIASAVIAIALLTTFRDRTGVKVARLGPSAWLLVLAGLVVVLGLFSVSLGLAASDLRGWIALPTVGAFAGLAALTFLFTKVARERMLRVA